MKKLDEEKVLRDPIYGYIRINHEVIWDCLNAPEFQRLRRIRQLGATFQVYHTAEHSRFSHSLGVYEVTRKIISENKEVKEAMNEYEELTVLLAALLHDLGHGPFSHSFEQIVPFNHEEYTCNIIRRDSKIFEILSKVDEKLPEDVASVIENKHPTKLLTQLVSSQLDADRMDYLLRDSYFTGTSYGHFDIDRIIRTLRVENQQLVIKESGMHTIEDYIMARYHMYWQVYYHSASRSFEAILSSLFKRYLDLCETDPEIVEHIEVFKPLRENRQLTNKELHFLDESACNYGFSQMLNCKDNILRDLADRVLNRRLFKCEEISEETKEEEYRKWIQEGGYDPTYYMYVDTAEQSIYQPYGDDQRNAIWVLLDDNKIEELSKASNIVNAILKGELKHEKRVFYPSELND